MVTRTGTCEPAGIPRRRRRGGNPRVRVLVHVPSELVNVWPTEQVPVIVGRLRLLLQACARTRRATPSVGCPYRAGARTRHAFLGVGSPTAAHRSSGHGTAQHATRTTAPTDNT